MTRSFPPEDPHPGQKSDDRPHRGRGGRGLRVLALAALGALLVGGLTSHASPDRLPTSLDGRFRAAFRSPFAGRQVLAPRADGTIGCFVEGPVAPAALERLGGRVGRPIGGRRTLRIPAGRVLEAARLPGVTRIAPALPMRPTLDLSAGDTRSTLLHQGLPDSPVGVQGDGALIGVIDSGIDWGHADFKRADTSTRIVAIWDQHDPIGPPPPGYMLGTVWNAAQINAAVCRQRDSTYYGHGTHVAGIAAGSGRATGNGWPQFQYVGVAPRADLLVVNTTFDDVDIADGIDWVFQQASLLGRPAVVNLSLGSDYGPHDGSNDLDQFINGVSGPGRVVVASCGNSNGRGRHGERLVPMSGDGVLSFRVFGYTPSPTAQDGISVDLWYPGGDNHLVTVRTPGGFSVGPVSKGAALAASTPDGWISIDASGVEATNTNGAVEVLVEVSDASGSPPTPGDFEIRLTRVSGSAASEADAWIYDWSFPFPPAFVLGKEEAELVITPSTADSAISVAAHTTRTAWQSINGSTYNYGQTLNQIANFSSPGPRRDGVAKPDLSAPGTAIGAAHSASSLPNPSANILPDGVHKVLQGTSMSAPQVTGAAALLLSRWPALSSAQIRSALMQSARSDAFTGVVPNNSWGRGKLDLGTLFAQRLAFATTVDPARFGYPGSSIGLLEMCALPSPGTWSTRYRVRVSDSQGWLHLRRGGAPQPVALYDTLTAAGGPGQSRCAPVSGQLTIDIPPLTPSGTATTVTFQVEPDGLPWLAVTRTTTVTATTTSGIDTGSLPTHLALAAVGGPNDRHRTVTLAVPTAGPARLTVFDVTGRRRAVLFDGSVPAGWTDVTWEGLDEGGRALASGVYLLKLDSAGASAVARLVWAPR